MTPKPFTWSYSKLKNYRTCPKRHWEIDIAKHFKEESEALTWGNTIHDAMANRISKGTPLPRTMEHYEDWPARLVKARDLFGLETKVENQLAMNRDFRPRAWFDRDVWFRGKLDVIQLSAKDGTALVVDWKTGQIKPDIEQLGLFAQLVFAHYPEIEEVSTVYVWLGSDDHTLERYKRDAGLLPLWNTLNPMIKAMEEAHRTTTYPPKPSGLCVHWCPVVSCPHHGKGDRTH